MVSGRYTDRNYSARKLDGPSPARDARSRVVSLFTSRTMVALMSVVLTITYMNASGFVEQRAARRAAIGASNSYSYHDLTPVHASPRGHMANQKVLILTPLKDAAEWIDEYFENLHKLKYPKELISLAFLVSDTTDDTITKLRKRAERLSRMPLNERYDSIQIIQKDFHFNLASEVRHGFEGQPVRRAFIARARNYLLTSALRPDHAWVLWLDVDVVRYDPDILMDLMGLNKDIVVPNTLWHFNSWDFWGFDRNNFAETEASLELLKDIGPDVMLVEGYRELMTKRLHLVDMPTHLGLAYVPLDGIGCTFTLVKANVHREGVVFPTYVFENEIETEGMAKMAKKAGFEVVGVPGLVVFHARNH
ncbi:BQ2448_2576 [Microbotryum intermedium]|uniref:BQ2448_2576 protein n=1 Tax=Microbotryum intermedium TaxID=269621 RepID=A0A238FEP8_9BASI|nr:BQ2448_2576 [Microbotryum intermedium]